MTAILCEQGFSGNLTGEFSKGKSSMAFLANWTPLELFLGGCVVMIALWGVYTALTIGGITHDDE